jgi:hypothetical protein
MSAVLLFASCGAAALVSFVCVVWLRAKSDDFPSILKTRILTPSAERLDEEWRLLVLKYQERNVRDVVGQGIRYLDSYIRYKNECHYGRADVFATFVGLLIVCLMFAEFLFGGVTK